MKRSPSFGMVMLLIVAGIVLLMVANAWRSTAPAMLDTQKVLDSGPTTTHGEEGAAEEIRSGDLPRLSDTKRTTDQHSANVQEAMQAID